MINNCERLALFTYLLNSNLYFSFQAHVVPWKLWFAVGGLLIVDVILLTIWTAVDPLKRDVHNFEKKPSSDPELDIEYQPQLEHCKSNHHSVWMGKSI